MNALENVKLRKTIKKSHDELNVNHSTNNQQTTAESVSVDKTSSNDELNLPSPTTTTTTATTPTNNGKLANRLSMFEQQNTGLPVTPSNLKFQLKKTPTINNAIEVGESLAEETPTPTTVEDHEKPKQTSPTNKPLPPPNKPARPAFNNGSNINNNFKAEQPSIPAALVVKLRPVNTTNTSTTNSNHTSNINAVTTSPTTNQIENKLLNKVNGSNSGATAAEQEKRSSVREIVQMLSSEESKVINKIFFRIYDRVSLIGSVQILASMYRHRLGF